MHVARGIEGKKEIDKNYATVLLLMGIDYLSIGTDDANCHDA